MRVSAGPTLVEPKIHVLHVASLYNSKNNGGVEPTMVASADATFVPIFCTLSLEAMKLMNMKLVSPLAILVSFSTFIWSFRTLESTYSKCLQPNNDKYMWNQVICT